MAEIFELNGKKIWIPTGPPKRLLPPDIEPIISMEEVCELDPEDYRRIYYERSGRFWGLFDTREGADRADPYRYARKFIPGGTLPWEK
jgi:hypothetical protein